MNWYRVYHGMPNDPKFALVQRHLASQSVTPSQVTQRGAICAVWTSLLDFASQNCPRGSLDGLSIPEVAVVLDYADETVSSIISAFESLGMISGNYLKAWNKRQPFREDDSTARTRKWRGSQNSNVTHGDASDKNVTHSDAVTPSRARRRDGDETETRREVSIKLEALSNTEHKGKTDDEVTERKDSAGSVNGRARGSVSSHPPSVFPDESNLTPQRIERMTGTLHAYMAMSGTPHERKFKLPDSGMVERCLRATGGAPLDEVGRFLHDRYSVHEQSPRHANGPKKYAWFETVLKTEFCHNGNGNHA